MPMLIVFAGFGKPISSLALEGVPNLAIRATFVCRSSQNPETLQSPDQLCAITFTIALSNNAIDVFDMVLTKVTPSDFEAIS
ncbi:hypothetical protein [Sinorhizobium meliloti]|uniref:hypothetical protein n=1 Tax=Rhizobium meliloti TaxID=382 RepID=UPI0018E8D12F|nr:hypothetical protein [Sinorhizobium meliloti]QQF03820.1 hypothetical protein JFX10_21295 [Sinorhizobium meliloti]